jgi:hypothetical protein
MLFRTNLVELMSRIDEPRVVTGILAPLPRLVKVCRGRPSYCSEESLAPSWVP